MIRKLSTARIPLGKKNNSLNQNIQNLLNLQITNDISSENIDTNNLTKKNYSPNKPDYKKNEKYQNIKKYNSDIDYRYFLSDKIIG